MFNLTVRQIKSLQKLKLGREEQMARNIPNTYHDIRFENGCNEQYHDYNIAVIGVMNEITTKEVNGKLMVRAKVLDRVSNRNLNIAWFGMYDIYKTYRYSVGNYFLVYGKLRYDENYHSFQMTNPFLFTTEIESNMRFHPVYSKHKRITDETIKTAIHDSVAFQKEEYISEKYLRDLPNINDAARMLHFPSSPEDISKAHQRLYFDDMLEFAVQMQEKEMPTGKPVVQINTAVLTGRIISELPYQLTNDQSQVINEIYGKLSEGNKLNALIQGDVACGKTITAFLLMFIAVENGYQSLIMAPTNVLATQHYGDLKEMGEKYGKTVVFLNSTLSTKERKVVLEQIANGEADLIVSTHSAIFQVEYYKLGLVVIDEEHKFGVETREKIRDKTIYDIPFITMSATPIPRTLASTIYGNVTKIFTIASMPSGRKPVNTIAHTGDGIPDILTTELQNGRQAYVVCPLIEVAQEDSLMSACKSVEETLEFYQTYYQACENIHIEALTGKTSKEETERILQDFKDNKIQILISTTVIEVGVNNPNATVIILQNAERYGLTSMHQLRGRVRRGSYEPYCVLCCKDGRDNERINIMCQTDNGFEIAEADLQMRKAGDLVGLKQSGANKTLDLILQYPVMYGEVKKIARQMLLEDDYIEFLQYMKELRCG